MPVWGTPMLLCSVQRRNASSDLAFRGASSSGQAPAVGVQHPPFFLYLFNTPHSTHNLFAGCFGSRPSVVGTGSSSLFFFAPSQEGKYLQAVIQYGKIVSWLEMEYGLSEKESKASDSFLLAAFLNLAMCYLKLREYAKAVECCDKVEARKPRAWSILSSCIFLLGAWGVLNFCIRSSFQEAVGWWHPFCPSGSPRMLRAWETAGAKVRFGVQNPPGHTLRTAFEAKPDPRGWTLHGPTA